MSFLTETMVERLLSEADEDKITVAIENGMMNPLFGIYPKILSEKLLGNIKDNTLKFTDFVLQNPHVLLPFNDGLSEENYRSINTREELKKAEEKWKQ